MVWPQSSSRITKKPNIKWEGDPDSSHSSGSSSESSDSDDSSLEPDDYDCRFTVDDGFGPEHYLKPGPYAGPVYVQYLEPHNCNLLQSTEQALLDPARKNGLHGSLKTAVEKQFRRDGYLERKPKEMFRQIHINRSHKETELFSDACRELVEHHVGSVLGELFDLVVVTRGHRDPAAETDVADLLDRRPVLLVTVDGQESER